MRILWHSSSPQCTSGYGIVGKEIITRLRKAGHFIRVATKHMNTGWGRVVDYAKVGELVENARNAILDGHGDDAHKEIELAQKELEGVEIFEGTNVAIINEMLEQENFDYLFSLYDIWLLHQKAHPIHDKWVAYVPVDTEWISDKLAGVCKGTDIKDSKDKRGPSVHIAMSKHGERELKSIGLSPHYAPHGVDTKIFRPKPKGRKAVRDDFNLGDDNFLIGSVGLNYGDDRKGFIPLMQAFKIFHEKHPEARLYIHSHAEGKYPGTAKYLEIINKLGIAKCTYWPHQASNDIGRIDAEWLADIYNAFDVFCLPTKGEGFGLPTCLLPGQFVYTQNGMEFIENIADNCYNMTHTGCFKKAEKTLKRKVVNAEITELILPLFPESLKTTKEHPYYILRPPHRKFLSVRKALKRGLKPRWIRAENIQNGDFVVIPIPRQGDSIFEIDFSQYTDIEVNGNKIVSRYSNSGENTQVSYEDISNNCDYSYNTVSRVLGKYKANVNEEIKKEITKTARGLGWTNGKKGLLKSVSLSYELGILFGYYIAEGWIEKNAVEFASHAKEKHYRNYIKQVLMSIGLFSARSQTRGNRGRLWICNKALAQIMTKLCGKGAYNKKIPLEYALNNHEFGRGIITGYWWGDGSRDQNSFSYCTVSRKLAYGLKRLLLNYGILASIIKSKSAYSFKDEKIRLVYAVNVMGKQSLKFAGLINEPFYNLKKRTGQSFIQYKNHFYLPIKEIKHSKYSGNVYNLEIREDQSYNIEGIIVHNCEAQACGIPCIVSDNTTGPELIGRTGWLIPCDELVTSRWLPNGGFRTEPNAKDVLGCLESAYDVWKYGDWGKLKKKVRKNVMPYSWDNVWKAYWKPLFKELEERLKKPKRKGEKK